MRRTIKSFWTITVISIAIIASFPGQKSLGSGAGLSAERENAKLAAKLLINKLGEKAKERQVDPNAFSKKMSDNPARYQERRDSWGKLQTEEKEIFLSWYQKEVEAILKGLNSDRPEGVDDYFTKEEKEAFAKCSDGVVLSYLINNFGKEYSPKDEATVFFRARKRACDLQLAKLIKDVYPAEDEVDTAVAKGQLNNLRIKILDRLVKKQKEPVFSENVNTLSSNFVDPILDDAKKQLEEQGSIVARSFGASYVMPEDIGSFIKDEITKYQENLKKEKQGKTIVNKVYTTFPSVQKKAADRANEIAIKRFRDAISEMSFPISKDVLEKLMNANLLAHNDKNKSWENCLKSFRDDIVKQAVEVHAAKAPEAKRSEFRKFLTSLISNSDQSCKDAMSELVDRSLKQEFEDARKEISQEQFREFFEPLEKETWKPSEQEIDSRYNRPSISSSAVSEPLKMPGISSKSFDSASLLEETIEMVRQAEESAIRRGLDALKDQMDTVEKLEFQMRSEVKTMNDPTIDKIVQTYTEKVKSTWSSSSFVKDYANLFTRTQDEIKRRAKSIVDVEIARRESIIEDQKHQAAIAQAEAEAKAKAKAKVEDEARARGTSKTLGGGDPNKPGKPGGGTPGISGGPPGGKGPAKKQEELGDEMPDVILDFGYESGRVYADIMFPKESEEKIRLFVDLNVNLNSSNMVIARKLFAGWLKDVVKRSKKDQQEINLYVFARVFQGNFVLYRMVYYFRECLIGALEDTGDQRIKIHWYDKLFDEPDDVEKYRGKPILPPKFNKKTMPRLWT